MMTRTVFLLAAALPLSAETPTVKTEKLHGRPAWVLENGIIRVSALRGGGHLGEIRFLSNDARKAINPMRVPHYPTIDPQLYDPARHDAIYGDSTHRWLSSGYMGHLLCFPSFGPSSEDEARNQLGNHGEAPIVEWKQGRIDRTADRVTLWYSAELPRTQYRVERAITLRASEPLVYVEEWVENTANFDRPINWVQHATFGPPFIEPGKSFYDVSGTRGEVGGGAAAGNSLKPGAEVAFPSGIAANGKPTDLRAMQTAEAAGTYWVVRSDPARPLSWFTMYHASYPVLIGYVFPAADNPWIADWQENKRNSIKPWNNQAVARGIEFGTTPFAEGLRKSVERGSLYGTPTYRWIGGRQKLKTTWTAFLVEVPVGYAGVQDVSVQDGRLTLVERNSGRQISIPATGLR